MRVRHARRRHRVVGEWLSAVVGFTSLSIVLTWPWARELWSGRVEGDAAQFVWDAWWVEERVFGLHNPWWTSDLYAPEGTYLVAHPLETLLMVLVSPVTALVGPTVTYGLLVLATISAAGVLAWRLALAMGLGPAGSWVAGILWASSPIVLYRAASGLYMLLLLAALLPAALLLARRLVHDVSYRSAIGLGVFLGACLLTDLQVTAYLLLAVGAVGLYGVSSNQIWRTRAALTRVAAVGATVLIVGSPAILMTIRAERYGDYRTPSAARVTSATTYNADAAQFLLPSPASRFFHDDYARAANRLGELSHFVVDSSVALGWATIALAIAGVAAARRSRRTWWLAGTVVVCGVLAVGPNPKAFGHVFTPLAVDVGEKVSLIAPATWLLGIPVLNDLRVPARYMQLGALPLALLAGIGARTLVAWRRPLGFVAVVALCAFAVVEGAIALHTDRPTGESLAKIIRDDPRTGVVVDVPISWQSGIDLVGAPFVSARAMSVQTIHEKPIAAGYIARLDRSMPDRLLARPLYRSLVLEHGDGVVPRGLAMPSRDEVVADARRLGAHWVVVWPEANRRVLGYLERIGYHRRAVDDGVYLYTR
jgi:hypothetical protein